MTTPFGYFDLIEAFAQPGCAVCRLLAHDVERFLDTLLYEYPVDPRTQNEFRASRGLCHKHTWALTQFNSALPTAILYNAVLDEMIQIVERTPAAQAQNALARLRGSSSGLAEALEAQKPCPACVLHEQAEENYLRVLAEYTSDERLLAAFRQSDGVCLPHLRMALRLTRDLQNQRLLSEVQLEKWTKLKGELGEFLHKMDAHYHGQMGAEATSWLRAMALVAGEKKES